MTPDGADVCFGQVELTDALQQLALKQPVYGYIHQETIQSIGPSRRLLSQEIDAFLSS